MQIASLSTLPDTTRQRILASLTDEEALALLYDWSLWARDKQQPPPGEWRYWLIMAGRGFGKTRTGAEMVRAWARGYDLVNIIGPTADDARDIMVEGESGILAVCHPLERPEYRPSKRRLEWPNGARTLIFTADEPERLRGKQHMKLWADELASWRYPEAWDQAMLGLRLGDNPQAVVTFTPKPIPIIKDLLKHPAAALTRGTTYENRANLAEEWYQDIIRKYEGTTRGQQELMAELLSDLPGALWTRNAIEDGRIAESAGNHQRVAISIDPAVSTSESASDTGILVTALRGDEEAEVLEDLTMKGKPAEWGSHAVKAYHRWQADIMVGEVNNGGDMIEHTIRMIDDTVNFKQVRASRGKHTRAEPISALYEQGRVHHVGMFAELEDQMCTWIPGETSPDRMDALVWGLTELMLGPSSTIERVDNPFYG